MQKEGMAAAAKLKEKKDMGKEAEEADGVEGLLRKLQIAEKKKCVTLGRAGSRKKVNQIQAVGKVHSEKRAFEDTLSVTLGRIWCQREGTLSKEIRRNTFMFTFGQASGKIRALEEGPWMVGKDLLVIEDFVESNTVDEYGFRYFPIWVRVSNLPLGRMNRETGELIGNAVGECIEVDIDEEGLAIVEFLRVKVRLDVREPLMRGIRVKLEEEEAEEEIRGLEDEDEGGEEDQGEEGGGTNLPRRWCSFSYEFLPDFCFTCGIIGHTDKECSFRLKKGDKQLYTRDLKALMSTPQRKIGGEEERGKWSTGIGGGPTRSNSSGGRGSWTRSDSESWRKPKEDRRGRTVQKRAGEEKEVTSPMKQVQPKEKTSSQKALTFNESYMVVDGKEIIRENRNQS